MAKRVRRILRKIKEEPQAGTRLSDSGERGVDLGTAWSRPS